MASCGIAGLSMILMTQTSVSSKHFLKSLCDFRLTMIRQIGICLAKAGLTALVWLTQQL